MTATLVELVAQLARPRAIWLMVPAAIVDPVLKDLVPLLEEGDTVVDGGNSYFHDDLRRSAELAQRGLHYVDVGVSGGVWGLERGYCLMIEYGAMAAYAEGFDILQRASVGETERAGDAETTPLRHPEQYRYRIDVAQVAELWRRGSVIGSWLLDLSATALRADPELAAFEGQVADSGEGRWTLQAAIDEGVPAPVLAAALFARFASRGHSEFANKMLSAMRQEFGGHLEKLRGAPKRGASTADAT